MERAAGLLVLHVWAEPGDRFRFRVTSTIDTGSDERSSCYAATRAEVLQVVRDWLDEVAPGA